MTIPLALDRRYLSRYASEQVGFTAILGGIPGDVDGNAVTATLLDAADQTTIRTPVVARLDTGRYGVVLTSSDTAAVRLLDLRFAFAVSGTSSAKTEQVLGELESAFNQFSNTQGNKLVFSRVAQKKQQQVLYLQFH